VRKQNSKFSTAFITETGSELKNKDYFGYMELDDYACYVMADDIEDLADCESSKEAVESIISKFLEKPSISAHALKRYLKYANEVLLKAEKYTKLRASIAVVVTDYKSIRYAYAGNVRLKLYRNNKPYIKTSDTSVSADMVKKETISEDVLSKHEERTNLYSYLGSKSFRPEVSKKIKINDTDIVALYTKGIWESLSEAEIDKIFADTDNEPKKTVEEVEQGILNKQYKYLDNYSIAAIFMDKVFIESDPTKKKRIKKLIIAAIIVVLIICIALVVMFFYKKWKKEKVEDMNSDYQKMLDYASLNNFIKADEKCTEALENAKKVRDRKKIELLNRYDTVLDSIIEADTKFDDKKYTEARTDYELILKELPYIDNMGAEHINRRINFVISYNSVNALLENGDILLDAGMYERARERFIEAKKEARDSGYEEGKVQAEAGLLKADEALKEGEAALKSEAEDKAGKQMLGNTSAASGDTALNDKDYNLAKTNYETAKEIYEGLGDSEKVKEIEEKLKNLETKIKEKDEIKQEALNYETAGNNADVAKDYKLAKENFDYARRLYRNLDMEVKVIEMDKKIEDIDKILKAEEESKEKETQLSTQATTQSTETIQSSDGESSKNESSEVSTSKSQDE